MDCEHFDTALMSALYDELDELTRAAMRRHREGCARCEGTWTKLSATHELAVLPLIEPGDELEDRIVAAIAEAQRSAPWPRRVARTLAWAGSQAMRPQLAAAAVLLIILGSSVLLLRPRPGSVGALPVHVTERGVPVPMQAQAPAEASDLPGGHPARQPAALAPRPPSAAPAPASGAMRGDDGERAKLPAGGSACSAAITALDEAMRDGPSTATAADTMWEAAECYRARGEAAQAKALYLALRETPSHGARALERLGAPEEARGATGVAAAAAPPAAARAAAPAAKASRKSEPAEAGASAKPAAAE